MAIPVSKAKIGVCLLAFLGVALLVIGIVSLSVLPSIFKSRLEENLALAEGKENYDKWKLTPVPVYFSIFLFNVTNPYEVEKLGQKPILQEVGPYVFKQQRRKDVMKWDPANKTVTYDDIKTYTFITSMSKDPEFMIYTLNMPILGISQYIQKLGFFLRGFATSALDDLLQRYKEGLFIHKPARVLMFEGYKVNIIEDLIGLVKPFAKVPEILPNNSFGFLYGKNNTGDGVFTVSTGVDDITKYTQITNWNNNSRLSWWKDQYCDMLNGTDGAQFPPPVTKNDILYVYVAELCRSIYLEYDHEVQVKGIPAYRFITPTRLFDSPKNNPGNTCYCTRKEYCELSGILDITSCRKGMPLAITGPHFYKAHPEIGMRIDGLKPDESLHETYVDIEPMTGMVLRASRKLQMNYLLEKFPNSKLTEHSSEAVFPLLWITEAAELDDHLASLFTAKVRTPLTVAKSVLIACIVLGLLWIATAGVVTVYILIKQQKTAKNTLKAQYKAVPQIQDENLPKKT